MVRFTNFHAFHQNLPEHHKDPTDGIPYVTKYADRKSRAVVKLCHSICLDESIYRDEYSIEEGCTNNDVAEEKDGGVDGDMQEDDEDEDENMLGSVHLQPKSMASIIKKCTRLSSQLSALSELKHGGISQMEYCQMLLHVLRLLCATVVITDSPCPSGRTSEESNNNEMENIDQKENSDALNGTNADVNVDGKQESNKTTRTISLHFANVGYIHDNDHHSYIDGMKTNYTSEMDTDDKKENYTKEDSSTLGTRLKRPFALPTPARQSLLSVAIQILSMKSMLRSISNAAILAPSKDIINYEEICGKSEGLHDNKLLIIHWKTLFELLLHTAPHLDEIESSQPPIDSSKRQSQILKRTVNMIALSRRFFDQGYSIKQNILSDKTAMEVWNLVKDDLLYHSHSNACFRALVLLHLFQPSRCTPAFYSMVMPQWLKSWGNVDRCSTFDFLWLTMFCRARKYQLPNSNRKIWKVVRGRILTQCSFWLQIPIGGDSSDTSFPRAKTAKHRGFPLILKKLIAGAGNSYQEGMDFVGKVSKLMIYCMGMNNYESSTVTLDVSNEKIYSNSCNTKLKSSKNIDSKSDEMTDGTVDALRFLSFVAPYFHPSNTGVWMFPLGVLLHHVSYELCSRIGLSSAMNALSENHPVLFDLVCKSTPFVTSLDINGRELASILSALLPLCRQALYSKVSHIGKAGESSLLYLAQIDPQTVCPTFLDFSTRALDVSSVHLSHQAPAALGALTRLVQPSLRADPIILLTRLPEILGLSLMGVDGNDEKKTLKTLMFYRNLFSWIPIGRGNAGNGLRRYDNSKELDFKEGKLLRSDGTRKILSDSKKNIWQHVHSKEYTNGLSELPESSLLHRDNSTKLISDQNNEEMEKQQRYNDLLYETALLTSDWSLSFLERIYALYRAAGEHEKTGKSERGVARHHSSADADRSRNFSRILRETLLQVFAAMDDETHALSVTSVRRFLTEETLPFAAKDVSSLCEASCSLRIPNKNLEGKEPRQQFFNPGLNTLLPILARDLDKYANKTISYRIRCLSGAVKSAGQTVLDHENDIFNAIRLAFSRIEDKNIFKNGCKLLRHTLSSQCESYIVSSDKRPRLSGGLGENAEYVLGKSAQLHNDGIQWHVPNGIQIDFASKIFQDFVCRQFFELSTPNTEACGENMNNRSDGGKKDYFCDDPKVDILSWRRALRILRYAMRGCSSLLLEEDIVMCNNSTKNDIEHQTISKNLSNSLNPHELATRTLLLSSSLSTQLLFSSLREKLKSIISSIMLLITNNLGNFPSGIEKDTPYSPVSDKELAHHKSDLERKSKAFSSSLVSFGMDVKICKEITDISIQLLLRRSAYFRPQEGKSIWQGQKGSLVDFALAVQTESLRNVYERFGFFNYDWDCMLKSSYGDGEDCGKTLCRRLVTTRVELFLITLQRNSSFEIPRRLRRRSLRNNKSFSNTSHSNPMGTRIEDVLQLIHTNFRSFNSCNIANEKELSSCTAFHALSGYEKLLNGLFAMSCHPNVKIQSSSVEVVEYAFTRFGWFVSDRVPRILDAISLQDFDQNRKYGLPSCAKLVNKFDKQGRRKRLPEVLKGILSILLIPHVLKDIMANSKKRFCLVRTLCETQRLISILPSEEMAKVVIYFQNVFSQFRSRFYSIPRICQSDMDIHSDCTIFLLDFLENSSCIKADKFGGQDDPEALNATLQQISLQSQNYKDVENVITEEKKVDNGSESYHWKNRLFVGWFLMVFVDSTQIYFTHPNLQRSHKFLLRLWTLCFDLIRLEVGQPLQRVSLSLLGRLISINIVGTKSISPTRNKTDNEMIEDDIIRDLLVKNLSSLSFCKIISIALVHDHREDKSVGGGHHAQWSSGIEEVINDASNNLAPQTFFPFQRTGRSSSTFKVGHAQLVESLIIMVGSRNNRNEGKARSLYLENGNEEIHILVSKHFLIIASEFASMPPSEDHRNQICTAAEIFSGVCRALLSLDSVEKGYFDRKNIWDLVLLPHLMEVIPKVPSSLFGAYSDALRYSIHFYHPKSYHPLVEWITTNIDRCLWQSYEEVNGEENKNQLSLTEIGPIVHDVPRKEEIGISDSYQTENEVNRKPNLNNLNADGFALQHKWISMITAVLIELNYENESADGNSSNDDVYSNSSNLKHKYSKLLPNSTCQMQERSKKKEYIHLDQQPTWHLITTRLLPRLLNSIGHPYEKCRSDVAHCLFRIFYCHRKLLNSLSILTEEKVDTTCNIGISMVKNSLSIDKLSSFTKSFKEHKNALMTVRKFISYCVHWGDNMKEYSDFIIPFMPMAFKVIEQSTMDDESVDDGTAGVRSDSLSTADRMLQAEVLKTYRYCIAEMSIACMVLYGSTTDLSRVLEILDEVSKNKTWQVRQAGVHFMRCFQGCHMFLFDKEQTQLTTNIVLRFLSDSRREVASAAIAALTGILASTPSPKVTVMVDKYIKISRVSLKKKKRVHLDKANLSAGSEITHTADVKNAEQLKEEKRVIKQQTSVYFLCAAVLAHPYDTPPYVPRALAALSRHSFESRAHLSIREAVKLCCREYKRTHMSDNWEVHRQKFIQEELEALEDVVSTPHYYA